ncbi:DUF2917 domain-containing protein [Herbaspirillum sp. NPDC087042]|uniref:DUF2917 domain-containing protein n=1 Tax=Herbaspirillum sp. NPDC087042 TaxID=3364004 RepID=UPI0038282732
MSIPFTNESSIARLEEGQTLAHPLRSAVRIRVRSGLVWLTVEEGGADVWLSPGRDFDFHGCGLAVFEAVRGAAEFEVVPLPGWGARLWRFIRGPGRPLASTATPAAASACPDAGDTVRISRLLPRGLIRWF